MSAIPPLSGEKRTSGGRAATAAFDPKAKLAVAFGAQLQGLQNDPSALVYVWTSCSGLSRRSGVRHSCNTPVE
jgi:hypothetical protein